MIGSWKGGILEHLFKDKRILITGGTGSVGWEITQEILKYNPRVIRLFDNNENAQFNFQQSLGENKKLRYLLGDVRDKDRLITAMDQVDIVFHTAGLKHVLACEYNPLEAVKTNVIGTQNVIEAALACNVRKVIFTSSDKAVNPGNTMGASKLVAEKLIISANYYRGVKRTIFSAVRFGNVMGSSGSVVPVFINQIKEGKQITITHRDMTRFVISPGDSLKLLFRATELAQGGEIFIMKMPVVRVTELAAVLYEILSKPGKGEMRIEIIGTKPGEKLYEELLTEEEASRAIETDELYIVLPYPELIANINLDINKYPSIGKANIIHYRSDKVEGLSRKAIEELLREKQIIHEE